MPRAAQKSRLVVIGIDIGTTHSGISYGHSRNRDVVRTVLDLEHGYASNNEQPKILTVVSYNDDGTVKNIGASAMADERRVQFPKLALAKGSELVNNAQTSDLMSMVKRQLAAAGKTPDEVLTDFIRVLFARAIESMTRCEGDRYFDHAQVIIIYTIPAIWGMNGKGRMQAAVLKSGIHENNPVGQAELYHIIEPEAAALAALQHGQDSDEYLERGNPFILCDLGGGTADVISYIITSSNPHRFREAAKGDGDITGGVLLDQRFQNELQKRVPSHVKLSFTDPGMERALNADWHQGIKPRFDGTDNQPWRFLLPHGPIGKSDPYIVFTAGELRAIFDIEINKAITLVQDQVDQIVAREKKLPVAILLVGGFGQSPYLYNRMKETFPGIQIIQRKGHEMWSAVSRGAVIHGFNTDSGSAKANCGVDSRIARYSYGTLYNELFDPELHAKKYRREEPILHQDVAVGKIHWFWKKARSPSKKDRACMFADFAKGDSVPVRKTLKMPCTFVLDNDRDSVRVDFVFCEVDDPPHWKDPEVKRLCVLNWDSPPPLHELEKEVFGRGLDQAEFYTVNYETAMVASGESVEFQIFYRNKSQADWRLDLDNHGEPILAEDEQYGDDDEKDEDFEYTSRRKRKRGRRGRRTADDLVLRGSRKRKCRA